MKMRNVCITGTLFVLVIFLMSLQACKNNNNDDDNDQPQTITDVDGNIYHTVTIGNQVWMLENLRVTHYRNGNPISEVTGNDQWVAVTDGAFCNYENNASNSVTYGKLYNWHAVTDGRGIAPQGWRVPTDEDYNQLAAFLGDVFIAGGKMKEAGYTHWEIPNFGATNSSGYTALPAGYRNDEGVFYGLGIYSYFWTTTPKDDISAYAHHLFSNDEMLYRIHYSKNHAFSVRCIKE